MKERQTIALLIVIMAAVYLTVAGVSITLLYLTAVADERGRLIEMAQREACLIDSIARFNKLHNTDFPGGPDAATISQIIEAKGQYAPKAEKTLEIVIGRREGDRTAFLVWKKRDEAESPKTLASDTPLAEPMRRAISGLSGSLVGLDYRGRKVLAAYEPAPDMNAGVVVKIDLAEVRAPFIRAGTIATVLGLFLVLGGASFFVRLTKPMIRRLAESEERFRVGAASASDLIWDWDIQRGRLDVFGNVDELLGYGAGKFPRTIEAWQKAIHPEDRGRITAALEGHLKKGVPYKEEYRVICRDGSLRYWTDRGSAILDKKGKAYRMVWACNDITEERLAKRALLASDARYRSLFNAAKDGILILDADTGQIVDVNPFIKTILGYSQEELLGKELWEIGAFKDIAANKENFLELQDKGYIRYEDMPLQTKDGRSISVEFISNVYMVNDAKVVQCNIRDITEEIQGKKVLRESEEKLRLAEEMGHLGHWNQDLRTNSVSWSNEMYRIFGVDRGDFTHTYEGILHLIHPEDRVYRDSITETIKREGRSDFEYRIIRPDGGLRYVTGKAEIVRDQSGEAVGIFGTTLDATEIKQKERELREQNAELERFTYTVSHDLKSPLVTVETFLGYLKQDIAGSDADRIEKDMDFMRTATFKMRNLLEELLEMSRVGRVVNNPVRVTFRELVEEALSAAAGNITQRGVKVRVGEERIMLYGDRPRLAEIWQNLIDNAVKFMGDQASPLIEIGAEKSGKNITFFVRDNGMGIEPQYQTKVLGLFEKLNPNIEGSGLGLALIKRIVELYRGTIWLESKGAGKGTCFRFTLPEAQTNRKKEKKHEGRTESCIAG